MELNPWKTIWRRPRDTIRAIVVENPDYKLWLLATIYAFPVLLSLAQVLMLGNMFTLLPILLGALIIAPLWGYIVFSYFSFFVYQVGKLFRSEGKFKEVRAALAWANAPIIANTFVWLVIISRFGLRLFQNVGEKIMLNRLEVLIVLSLLLLQLLALIFAVIFYVSMLAEVQKFSIGKTILTLILSAILIGIASFLLFSIFYWVGATFFNIPIAP